MPSDELSRWDKVCSAGKPGPKGPAGRNRTEPVPKGLVGRPGVVSRVPAANCANLHVHPSHLWISSMVHQAELDLANEHTSDAVCKLRFATTLLNTVARSTQSAESPGNYAPVRQKIQTLLMRIDSNLDAFGRNRNYVNLTSSDFNREILLELLTLASNISKSTVELKRLVKNQNAERVHAQAAIADVENSNAKKAQEIEKSFGEVQQLQAAISTLGESLDPMWEKLHSADADFQRAVRKTAGCRFDNVLKFGSMVTTIVATSGAGFGTVAAAGQMAKDIAAVNEAPARKGSWIENGRDDLQSISKAMVPVGETLDEAKNGYAKAKALHQQLSASDKLVPEGPGKPSDDYVKLVASKAEFDKQIQPFLALPEAQRYKALMDNFVSTSETRNNKIIEHDEKVARINDAMADLELSRSEAGEISAAIEYDFDLPALFDYLNRSLDRLKWDIARSLTTLAKTVEYLSLEPIVVRVDDRSISTLESSMAHIMLEYKDVMDSFGSPAIVAKGIKIPLVDLLTDQQRQTVLDGRPAMFSINPSHNDRFSPRYSVTTLRIGLGELPEEITRQDLSVRFEHQGRSVMRARDGQLHVYSHEPVIALFQSNIRGAVVQNGELINERSGRYMGVSPYGPWKIDFGVRSKDELLAILDKAVVVFDVRGRVLPIS